MATACYIQALLRCFHLRELLGIKMAICFPVAAIEEGVHTLRFSVVYNDACIRLSFLH